MALLALAVLSSGGAPAIVAPNLSLATTPVAYFVRSPLPLQPAPSKTPPPAPSVK